jgi:hypothetical protein
MKNEKQTKINQVSASEQSQISRTLLAWLNRYTDKPSRIEFEALPKDKAGMSLTTVEAAYKTEEYVDGSYEAQYQFAVMYRTQPEYSGDRLEAEEILNALGEWVEEQPELPNLGGKKTVKSIEITSTAGLVAKYEDKSEDYRISMVMIYEVESMGL